MQFNKYSRLILPFLVLNLLLMSVSGWAVTNGSNDANSATANAVVRVAGCTGTLITSQVVITAGHCISRPGKLSSVAAPRSGSDWQTPGTWYPLSPRRILVEFGADRRNLRATYFATEYSLPVRADIIALKLERTVSRSVARPMSVLTQPISNLKSFLKSSTFDIVGWGQTSVGGPTAMVRQKARARHVNYPCGQPFKLCTTKLINDARVLPGDSGSPLIVSIGQKKMVVGVLQGLTSSGGVYVSTFHSGGKLDRKFVRPSANIGSWLEHIISPLERRNSPSNNPCKDLEPLNLYYSSSRNDFILLADSKAENYHLRIGYRFVSTEGYLFKSYMPGTIPLSLWWNRSRTDNVTVANERGIDMQVRSNYSLVKVHGYILPKQIPGTISLKLFWSHLGRDNVTLARNSTAAKVTSEGYKFANLEGYIFKSRSACVARAVISALKAS